MPFFKSLYSVPFPFALLWICTGMNGKSILSAISRHTPEHSNVMSTAGSGATTSPCSSRSSSQRSGTGAHTPGGPHLSPCTRVKTLEGSSNALTPNTGPAKSPVSPKLSPGMISHNTVLLFFVGLIKLSLTSVITAQQIVLLWVVIMRRISVSWQEAKTYQEVNTSASGAWYKYLKICVP